MSIKKNYITYLKPLKCASNNPQATMLAILGTSLYTKFKVMAHCGVGKLYTHPHSHIK